MQRVLDLDLRGLKCPLPVLRTRKALRDLSAGDRLIVACTDPLANLDIPHMVVSDGHVLERQHQDGGAAIFHILKASRA